MSETSDSEPAEDESRTEASAASDGAAAQTAPAKRGFKPGPLIVIAIVLAIFALVQIQRKAARQAASEAAASGEMTTIVVAVDGQEQAYTPVPWSEGQTVLDAMEALRRREPAFTFDYDGHDQFAKLKRIGEQENEGGSPTARNWTYYINGEFAKQSFAIQELSPGARILWKFGTSE